MAKAPFIPRVRTEFVTVAPADSLRFAINRMTEDGCQFVCVVDSERIVGVMTDGDIRRGLLSGRSLDAPAGDFMNVDFAYLVAGYSPQQAQKLLTSFEAIPVVTAELALVGVVSRGGSTVYSLAEPFLTAQETDAVSAAAASGWISSRSQDVALFEVEFSDALGLPAGLAVSNGTDAIELALLALGLQPGDEVMLPNLTFGATASAVVNIGCVPVLVDVESGSLGLDPSALARALSPRTRAVLVVHLYGKPASIEAIMRFAEKHGLLVVEDCAEAIGTLVAGKQVGSFGDAGTFSFFANKTLTTGEGGFVVFRDSKALERAAILRDHGMVPEKKYWHEVVGHNYRMTGLQASLGRVQVARLETLVEGRRKVFDYYRRNLTSEPQFEFDVEPGVQGSQDSHWLSEFRLSPTTAHHRDRLISLLLEQGVEARPYFYPLHVMPAYRKFGIPGQDYKVSTSESARGVCLPSSSFLEPHDVQEICRRLEVAWMMIGNDA